MDHNLYLTRLYNEYDFFVTELWRDRGLDKLAPLTWAEYDILDYIANGPPKRGVLAPRGLGKTTWGTASYTSWRLFRDAATRVLIVSKSEGHAKKIVKMIRGWISAVPFLQHLQPKPDTKDRVWRDNTDGFDVGPSPIDKQESVKAIGINGQLAGNRAHVVIGDDVEDKSNTKTLDAREELDNTVKEFSEIASYGDREVLYFGTPHHEQSLYTKLDERGYAFRTWPLLYPKAEDKILNLAPKLAARLTSGEARPNDIVFGPRVTPHLVAEKQAEGRIHFAMQQMLIANMGDETLYPLRLRDLIVFDCHHNKAPLSIAWGLHGPKGSTRIDDIASRGLGDDALYRPIMLDETWVNYNRKVMWIDPAKANTDRQDKIGYAIAAYCMGWIYLLDVGGIGGRETADNLALLAMKARAFGVTEIHVEDYGMQSLMAQLLEPIIARHFLEPGEVSEHPDGWKAAVILTKPPMSQSQKEHRIISVLDRVTAQHRLVVDRRVAENEAFQYQLTRITRQRECLPHDDEIDATANAVALFSDDLRTDPEKAAARQRERFIDEELEAMRRGECTGRHIMDSRPRPAPRWFQHR